MGLIKLERGKHHCAHQILNQSLSIDPNNSATLQLLGEAFIGLGLPYQALEVAQKSLRLNSDDAATYCTLGKAQSMVGNITKSKELFLKSLEIDGSLLQSALNLSINLNSTAEASNLLKLSLIHI